jgi:hypothetical protein
VLGLSGFVPSVHGRLRAGHPRETPPRTHFDLAYVFGDIDEAVRAAQENDQEVILTISGTPRWANGGKNPEVTPRRVADFTGSSRAIAARYSGRFAAPDARGLWGRQRSVLTGTLA